MKETLVYGGAFNPPTLAHMKIIETCQERFPKSDIWVMPSGVRKDKMFDTDRTDRVNLLRAMIDDLPKNETVDIDETELDDTYTETAVTVEKHRTMFPERSFKYIFGADSYLSMPTWDNGLELQETLPMLIVPRLGSMVVELTDNAELLKIPKMKEAVSSTLVRENIAEGRDIGSMVCESVARYIKQTRLYELCQI